MVSMFALGLSTSGFEPGQGHCCEHSWAIYVGYSPSFFSQDGWILAKFFFACLWTETESRSINLQKKNKANIQPS